MLHHTIRAPRTLLAKFGYAGLAFFTVKGLCWLLVPAVIAWVAG